MSSTTLFGIALLLFTVAVILHWNPPISASWKKSHTGARERMMRNAYVVAMSAWQIGTFVLMVTNDTRGEYSAPTVASLAMVTVVILIAYRSIIDKDLSWAWSRSRFDDDHINIGDHARAGSITMVVVAIGRQNYRSVPFLEPAVFYTLSRRKMRAGKKFQISGVTGQRNPIPFPQTREDLINASRPMTETPGDQPPMR